MLHWCCVISPPSAHTAVFVLCVCFSCRAGSVLARSLFWMSTVLAMVFEAAIGIYVTWAICLRGRRMEPWLTPHFCTTASRSVPPTSMETGTNQTPCKLCVFFSSSGKTWLWMLKWPKCTELIYKNMEQDCPHINIHFMKCFHTDSLYHIKACRQFYSSDFYILAQQGRKIQRTHLFMPGSHCTRFTVL